MFLKCFNKKIMLIVLSCCPIFAGSIHVNQLGYYSSGTKTAIAVGATGNSFSLVSASTGDVAFTKDLGTSALWDASNETTKVADFSEFTTAGEYKVRTTGCDDSYAFKIGPNVCLDLAKASIKALYYQRASMALESQYAGTWARAAGHPDNAVVIHPSAASSTRASGTKISCPGGWYDAGDYGKYVTNSGISTYQLFAAYQAFTKFYDTLNLNIPESSNSIPDILDEALYNFKWMLTMQDNSDGGVYHKLTTENFCGFVMPASDNATRYVVKKTTPAALDFAAVAAQAARVFKKFDSQMPGFSQSCLDASLKAWKWARANKSVLYNQSNLNSQYDPDINTGEYGDTDPSDEFKWAATELYLTTRADSFFTIAYPSGNLDNEYSLPGCTSCSSFK
jgi:endoglucanase